MPKPKNRVEALAAGGCLWMGGEAHADEFCGNRKKPGSSYCRKHGAIVYRPTNNLTEGKLKSFCRFVETVDQFKPGDKS